MPSDRRRLLELALESLENKKRRINEEIAEIVHELGAETGAVLKGGTAAKIQKNESILGQLAKEEKAVGGGGVQ